MATRQSNRLLPLIASVVALMAIVVGLRACTGDPDGELGRLEGIPHSPAPDADTPAETIRTLTARVADMTNEMKALRRENTELRADAKDRERSLTDQILNKVRAEQNRVAKPERPELLDSLMARIDGLSQQVTDLKTEQPLPIGQGSITPEPEGLIWIEPLDLPIDTSSSSAHRRLLTDDTGHRSSARDTEERQQFDQPSSRRASEPEPIPHYTVPRNATLIGSTGMTALIGRIPVRGRVEDPVPFKVIVGKDNLAANGLTIPNLDGMIWSGTAVGDWTLSCVTGRLESVTFVFADGTVRTLANDQGGERLGWISDERGIPCVSGERITNAAAFISKRIALTAAEAAAEAAAAAQTTTRTSSEGTSTASVTGNLGRYVLGKSIAGGTEEISRWLLERERQSFDAVFVPSGSPLAIHVDQELHIDYDPRGRKLSHVTPTDPFRRPELD